MKLSKHFDSSEFECKHCGGLPPGGVSKDFINMLELLRFKLGERPIVVTSGYRCPEHNGAVGGAPNSLHMSDPLIAADIRVEGRSSDEVAEAAKRLGFTGVGVYDHHVHVDLRHGVNTSGIVAWDLRGKKA